jgi:hypothetical protein
VFSSFSKTAKGLLSGHLFAILSKGSSEVFQSFKNLQRFFRPEKPLKNPEVEICARSTAPRFFFKSWITLFSKRYRQQF